MFQDKASVLLRKFPYQKIFGFERSELLNSF